MNIKKINCTKLQEKIAWNRDLSSEERLHSIECHSCGELLLQFEEVDAIVKQDEIHIPDDFSNTVMKRIFEMEKNKSGTFLEIYIEKILLGIEYLFHTSLVHWGVGGVTFFIAIAAH